MKTIPFLLRIDPHGEASAGTFPYALGAILFLVALSLVYGAWRLLRIYRELSNFELEGLHLEDI